MKVAYLDLIAGASGDMILGALLDSGLELDKLKTDLSNLKIDDFDLSVQKVSKNGFIASKLDVVIKDNVPERHLPEIEDIINLSEIPNPIKEKAIEIFHKLGQVEARIHGTTIDQVHLHELGGVDTIIDVVGVLLGLEALGIQEIFASPVPLGRGFIQGAHGNIPLPAPATIALLKGVPITGLDIQAETVTPTGAVLLSTLCSSFGPIPPIDLETIGYGAGSRDLPIPNLVRLLIGESADHHLASCGTLILMDTNIDDMNPEIYDYLLDRLFASGALDVFFSPIQMKKNRPATRVQVLTFPRDSEKLREIIFEETSTLGIRQQTIERYALHRETKIIDTAFGKVRMKIARLGNQRLKFSPEYEDCRQLAITHEVPINSIYKAAVSAATSLFT